MLKKTRVGGRKNYSKLSKGRSECLRTTTVSQDLDDRTQNNALHFALHLRQRSSQLNEPLPSISKHTFSFLHRFFSLFLSTHRRYFIVVGVFAVTSPRSFRFRIRAIAGKLNIQWLFVCSDAREKKIPLAKECLFVFVTDGEINHQFNRFIVRKKSNSLISINFYKQVNKKQFPFQINCNGSQSIRITFVGNGWNFQLQTNMEF